MNVKWKPIVPSNFKVPYLYEAENFVFSPLTVEDVEEDYEAIMNSIDHLKSTCIFDFYPEWPRSDMTKSEDLSNLGWHQTEFELKTSFAYKVQSKSTKEYVGCVYIFPSNSKSHEVDVYTWVKESNKDLDDMLFKCMRKWIKESWQFIKVNYPNRAIIV